MNIEMNVVTTDPSWTRDWVGVKVMIQTSYLSFFCCGAYYRYRIYNGYG